MMFCWNNLYTKLCIVLIVNVLCGATYMKKQRVLCVFLVFLVVLNGFTIAVLSQTKQGVNMVNNNDSYDLLIILPNQFVSSVNPLVDHKNTVGIKTVMKTTEAIYDEYIGVDEIEEIKYFIKDAIEDLEVSYVLLLGDVNLIPIRTTAVSWEYFGNMVVSDVLTDLYYADIYDEQQAFSIWDTNQDGVYSEVRMIMDATSDYNETLEVIDKIEGKPDVMVGRIPCSNQRDVQNVIDKIITYETTTFGSDWFNRLILMGGDTFPNTGGINEGEVVTEYVSSVMTDFTPITLWTSLQRFRFLIINAEISKGAGFVSYSGHGLPYGIATSPPDDTSQISYYTPFILGLKNKDKYPIMYFDACLTAKLDYQLFNIDFPCFAWSMIKKPNAGAIACIGATRTGFGGFAGDPFMAGASSLHAFFFDSYEPGIHLGEMFSNAQYLFIDQIMEKVMYDPLTIQEFTLLGDPSLKIGGYQ